MLAVIFSSMFCTLIKYWNDSTTRPCLLCDAVMTKTVAKWTCLEYDTSYHLEVKLGILSPPNGAVSKRSLIAAGMVAWTANHILTIFINNNNNYYCPFLHRVSLLLIFVFTATYFCTILMDSRTHFCVNAHRNYVFFVSLGRSPLWTWRVHYTQLKHNSVLSNG